MNANTYTEKQKSYFQRIGTYRSAYSILKEWMLVNVRVQGQRWILSTWFQKKNQKSTPSSLVRSKWSNWRRMAFRPYLSYKKLCKSFSFTKSNLATKYSGKQQKHSSVQCQENSLSQRTSLRQKIWWTTLLFNMSSRKNKTITQEMERTSSFRRGLGDKICLV